MRKLVPLLFVLYLIFVSSSFAMETQYKQDGYKETFNIKYVLMIKQQKVFVQETHTKDKQEVVVPDTSEIDLTEMKSEKPKNPN